MGELEEVVSIQDTLKAVSVFSSLTSWTRHLFWLIGIQNVFIQFIQFTRKPHQREERGLVPPSY